MEMKALIGLLLLVGCHGVSSGKTVSTHLYRGLGEYSILIGWRLYVKKCYYIIVVISRKKAADTGSLLNHFICLALGLLSMKQMERNCIISRVE